MRRISECSNVMLTKICKKSYQLAALNQALATYMPEPYKSYCEVSSFNHGRLKICLKRQSMASEMRFILPELRDVLRNKGHFYNLTSIDIVYDFNFNQFKKMSKRSVRLSKEAMGCVSESAQTINYQPLQEALLRLARDDEY